MINGLDRALRNTGLAIDALFRMDIEHLLALVEAFDGADDNTVGISAANARLGNNVSHETCLSKLGISDPGPKKPGEKPNLRPDPQVRMLGGRGGGVKRTENAC